jgi:hypothetical protein
MSSLADLGPAVSALGSSSVLVAASFVTWRVGCAGARAVEARSTVEAVGTISTKFPMSLLAGRISGCQYPRIGTSLSDLPAESQVEAREVDPGLPIPLR